MGFDPLDNPLGKALHVPQLVGHRSLGNGKPKHILGDLGQSPIGKAMFHIQVGDQRGHLRPYRHLCLNGQGQTVAVSTATHLDDLLILGCQRSDRRNIHFLGSLPNGSLHFTEICSTVLTVAGFYPHTFVWISSALSTMALVSWLTSGGFPTLLPLTPRSRDQFL